MWPILLVVFIVVLIIATAIRVVREYEKGVIFRLGRLIGAKGPGLFFVWPIIDNMVKVDLRVITFDVAEQEVITIDNVTTRVDAVVYYKVVNPSDAITKVERYPIATAQMAATTLRSVVGKNGLDDLLSERDRLNGEIQKILDENTDPWGIKVTAVEIKNVTIPEAMQRAMAAQAEAERERRARIIAADGEKQAAKTLSEAARALSETPGALYMRTLQTISQATQEKASTVVLPLPIELLQVVSDISGSLKKQKGTK
jgi:regulator of protease activity HflC (stomatin/prohibitin superfamily)